MLICSWKKFFWKNDPSLPTHVSSSHYIKSILIQIPGDLETSSCDEFEKNPIQDVFRKVPHLSGQGDEQSSRAVMDDLTGGGGWKVCRDESAEWNEEGQRCRRERRGGILQRGRRICCSDPERRFGCFHARRIHLSRRLSWFHVGQEGGKRSCFCQARRRNKPSQGSGLKGLSQPHKDVEDKEAAGPFSRCSLPRLFMSCINVI